MKTTEETKKTPAGSKILILLFLLIICIPMILSFLPQKAGEETSIDNKAPEDFPEFSLSEYSTFHNKFDQWLSDHLPFKTQMVKLYRGYQYRIYFRFDHSKTILGENDWLFYADEMDNYKRITPLTEEELEEGAKNISNFAASMKEQGIDCTFIIAPEKEFVYSEYIPDYFRIQSYIGRGEQMLAYIKKTQPEISLYYPLDFLRSLDPSEYPLYYSTDTHWTKLAAFAVSELTENINQESILNSLEKYKNAGETEKGMDLANMVGLSSVISEKNSVAVDYAGGFSSEKTESVDHGTIQRYRSTNSNGRNLLILGDSFGESMIEAFTQKYENVLFVTRGSLNRIDLSDEKPDQCFVIITERNIDYFLTGIY